jgi:hypothetical protein
VRDQRPRGPQPRDLQRLRQAIGEGGVDRALVAQAPDDLADQEVPEVVEQRVRCRAGRHRQHVAGDLVVGDRKVGVERRPHVRVAMLVALEEPADLQELPHPAGDVGPVARR